LVGGLLCLVGGYLVGYDSGIEAQLKGIVGGIDGAVNSLPFIPGLVGQLTTDEWYLIPGLVLVVVGLLMVVIGGGGGGPKAPKQKAAPVAEAPVRPPGSCKFCGADLKGSKTYCPVCGRSQT
jgi:hypothetical protein